MQNTKEIIKKEALYLFATLGYESAALSEIADRVGIKKASIYSHYQKKEDLFFEIYNQELEKRLSHFSRSLILNEGKSIEDRLFLIFKEYIDYYSQNKVSGEFMVRFSFFPQKGLKEAIFSNQEIKNKRYEFFEKLSTLFTQGQKDKTIKEIEIKDLLTSYYWLCNLCILKMVSFGKNYDLNDIKKEWQLYFNGIRCI